MSTYEQLKLEKQLCFPLYAAARKIVNLYTPYLKPLDLTYTQYIVFLYLWEHNEAKVSDLCRTLYLDNGTITPLLKKMEAKGWITRCRSKEDERIVHVTLTEAGTALKEKAKDIPFKVGCCMSIEGLDSSSLYNTLYQILNA